MWGWAGAWGAGHPSFTCQLFNLNPSTSRVALSLTALPELLPADSQAGNS